MKSVVEEASSIVKAIDKAWVRAGKPREFSVKVFEEPQRNFFGLTVKSAKIAIFFGVEPSHEKAHESGYQGRDRQRPHQREQRGAHQGRKEHGRSADQREHRQYRQDRPQQQHPREHEARQQRHERPARHDRREQMPTAENNPRPEMREHTPSQEQRPRNIWNEAMVGTATNWIKECLSVMGLPNVEMNTSVKENSLRIDLDTPIADRTQKERLLLGSFAHLAMEAIRSKYKENARGLRIFIGISQPS